MGLGGGVGVAQRLVGDQQVPVQRGQLGRVAVEHAVGHQRDAGPVAERAVEARAAARRSGGGRRATSTSTLGASGGRPRAGAPRQQLVAPLAEQPALGDDHRPQPRRGGGAVRERAAGGDRLAGAGLGGVDAGADDLQRGQLALAAEQHRVVGQRPRADHAHELAGAGVERDLCAGALELAQFGDRLLGDDAAGRRRSDRRRW